jgi:hypothetical protein
MSSGAALAYVGGAFLIAWGGAHLAPTGAVAASFGDISGDNRRIVVMEWIAEGITHVSLGVLVILITAFQGVRDPTTELVYRIAAGILVALAVLTAMTGARTSVVWFRVCPFVLTTAAALLLFASRT